MKEESGVTSLVQGLFICIGSYLIGSEYSAALGWGVWFIAMSMN
jgi:hypothetical protein